MVKKRNLFLALVVLVLLAIPAVAFAKGAFDEFGYNYNARMFNGRYCDYDRVIGGSFCDVDLIMKWSDEWLNKDRVRCAGTPNEGASDCDGAWLTNHQKGEYEDGDRTCKWTYFVKIVYPGYAPVDVDPADGYDDASGGDIIWGSFVVIQRVLNDACAGDHGVLELVTPAGFGAWK